MEEFLAVPDDVNYDIELPETIALNNKVLEHMRKSVELINKMN